MLVTTDCTVLPPLTQTGWRSRLGASHQRRPVWNLVASCENASETFSHRSSPRLEKLHACRQTAWSPLLLVRSRGISRQSLATFWTLVPKRNSIEKFWTRRRMAWRSSWLSCLLLFHARLVRWQCTQLSCGSNTKRAARAPTLSLVVPLAVDHGCAIRRIRRHWILLLWFSIRVLRHRVLPHCTRWCCCWVVLSGHRRIWKRRRTSGSEPIPKDFADCEDQLGMGRLARIRRLEIKNSSSALLRCPLRVGEQRRRSRRV